MQHPRVVAGLVPADLGLLVQHRDLVTRGEQRPGRGQPHDPCAHDDHLVRSGTRRSWPEHCRGTATTRGSDRHNRRPTVRSYEVAGDGGACPACWSWSADRRSAHAPPATRRTASPTPGAILSAGWRFGSIGAQLAGWRDCRPGVVSVSVGGCGLNDDLDRAARAGWTAGWWLLWRVPTVRRPHEAASARMVTDVAVVIPARDEADALPELLALARRRRTAAYVRFVVVDDGSTRWHRGSRSRSRSRRCCQVSRLPPGWTGKSWACQQGALNTSAPVLVFLDADVRLRSRRAPCTVGRARGARRAGLRCAVPSDGWPCGASVRAVQSRRVHGRRRGPPTVATDDRIGAFGPCMVCRRTDYEAVGGHAAVRGSVTEDLALADAFTDATLPTFALSGRGSAEYRMYPLGLPQLVEGWSKNLATGARFVPPLRSLLIALWIVGHVGGDAVLGAGGELAEPRPHHDRSRCVRCVQRPAAKGAASADERGMGHRGPLPDDDHGVRDDLPAVGLVDLRPATGPLARPRHRGRLAIDRARHAPRGLTCHSWSSAPRWAVLVDCVVWVAVGVITGYVAYRWPASRLAHDGPITRVRPFEQSGRWYERRWRIQSWKDRLPEAGSFFAGGFSKRALTTRRSDHLRRFVVETRRAELTHWVVLGGGAVLLPLEPVVARRRHGGLCRHRQCAVHLRAALQPGTPRASVGEARRSPSQERRSRVSKVLRPRDEAAGPRDARMRFVRLPDRSSRCSSNA